MLKIDHLRKNYGSFALDCSLEVQPGCITGLIGQNGAGKSTTFKAVLGLISTDGGSIRIFGKDLKDFSAEDKQKLERVSDYRRYHSCYGKPLFRV